MILTYKYRIKDRSARKALRRHASAVNFVWNYCVAHQRDVEARYKAGAARRNWLTHFELQRQTSGTSRCLGIQSHTIGEVCRGFVKSRDERRRAPRFRVSNGPKRSLGWIPFRKTGCQIDGNCVTYFGKSYRFWLGSRPVPEAVKSGTFVEDARGRWYVCFNVEVSELKGGDGSIGIDLGLKTLASCSDGSTFPALRSYRKYESKLSVAQRAGNKRRVRAIHAKITNTRLDHLHKASAKIARENSLIIVGNVSPTKLLKTRMAKSVSDAGWSMFRNMLRYKASRHGARYEEVDERWTSQTCSRCGVIPASSPKGMGALGIRRWECDCGAVHDRDVNAAINILDVALSAQRHADGSRRSPDMHDSVQPKTLAEKTLLP